MARGSCIQRWLEEGKQKGSTHVVVMCDTFDHENYPVFATSSAHAKSIVSEKDGNNMQRVMEVYALHLDWESQMSEHRAFHYEDPPKEATGAPTGRHTNQGPVLQNIPLRTETGRQLRDAFTGPPLRVEADFAAIEKRLQKQQENDPMNVKHPFSMCPSLDGSEPEAAPPGPVLDPLAPRAFTEEEMQKQLLDHIRATVRYWATVKPKGPEMTMQERLEGVAFSILSTLDGCSAALPGFRVTPAPHPADKEYRQSQGENWWPDDVDLTGSLHELFARNK